MCDDELSEDWEAALQTAGNLDPEGSMEVKKKEDEKVLTSTPQMTLEEQCVASGSKKSPRF